MNKFLEAVILLVVSSVPLLVQSLRILDEGDGQAFYKLNEGVMFMAITFSAASNFDANEALREIQTLKWRSSDSIVTLRNIVLMGTILTAIMLVLILYLNADIGIDNSVRRLAVMCSYLVSLFVIAISFVLIFAVTFRRADDRRLQR